MISNTSKQRSLPSDQDSSGGTLGDEEIKLLGEVIASGTLTSIHGKFVKQVEHRFAELLQAKFASCTSHGSAALHAAYAAIDPEPGDEIITTSITDMGALTPIIYQSGVPVFADVDPYTLNVTAATIEPVISDRTRAIVVTHLFGNPCDMGPIMELAGSRNIPVIEDCAQALFAKQDGRYVGTFGNIGCFSFQQGNQITTGEGGIVVTRNQAYAQRMFLFINKAWGSGDENPDHYFLAPNYRMNELTGAVAAAQLEKLNYSVDIRIKMADQLTSLLKGLPGITTPRVADNSVHTYWKYCLNVDARAIRAGATGLAAELNEHFGIESEPGYLQKPAFMCKVIREQRTFGNSRFPFTHARPESCDYSPEKFTGTFSGLDSILVMPWNEGYNEEHVNYIATAIKASVKQLSI